MNFSFLMMNPFFFFNDELFKFMMNLCVYIFIFIYLFILFSDNLRSKKKLKCDATPCATQLIAFQSMCPE